MIIGLARSDIFMPTPVYECQKDATTRITIPTANMNNYLNLQI